jgi:hypothetical protein
VLIAPRGEARRIHCDSRLAVRVRHQSVDGDTQDLLQHRFVESAENAVHGRISGHVPQPQCRTQLCVFGETDFGFAEGPILVPHQAEDREQLGLPEPMCRTHAAVGRQHRLAEA